MTVIYYMSIDRADKPWIGDRRLTETTLRPPGPADQSPPSDPRGDQAAPNGTPAATEGYYEGFPGVLPRAGA